jgi:hypothetical protein
VGLNRIRDFLAGPDGRKAGVVLLAVAVIALFVSLRSTLGDDPVTAMSRDRMYVCAETGKPFRHTVKAGDVIPIDSPHSGKKTGYPAELCFWTGDGNIKSDPTPVLLNHYAGKTGPTFCPDCGRLVVGLNPPPQAGDKPPPKQSEYALSRKDNR